MTYIPDLNELPPLKPETVETWNKIEQKQAEKRRQAAKIKRANAGAPV